MSEVSALRTRVSVAAFFFVSGFGFASFASRIADLQQKLHLSNAALGSALFVMPLGLLFTMPFTNYLLGKHGSRKVMLAGCIGYSVFLCCIGFATQTWQFAVGLFLFGASRNLMNIPINAQGVGVQNLYNKSIISSFHGIWSVSGFLAASLGGYMIKDAIGTEIHFLIVALLLLAIVSIFYKHTYKHDLPTGDKKKMFSVPNGNLLKIGLIAFTVMSCEGTMYDWSSVYFKKVVQAVPAHQAWGYIAFTIAVSSARFVGDWFVNKFGVKKILLACGSFTALGFFVSAFFPTMNTAILGFALIGIGVSCVVPFTMSLAGKFAGNLPLGQAIASISTIGYFGFLIGPPLMGYIAEWKNLQWSFGFSGLMAIAMVILVKNINLKKG